MMSLRLIARTGLAAFSVACGSNEAPPAEARAAVDTEVTAKAAPPSRSAFQVYLEPSGPLPGDIVHTEISSNSRNTEITYTYIWSFDGARLAGGETAARVPSTAKKGDLLSVAVRSSDNLESGEEVVAEAVVANRPPEWKSLSLDATDEITPQTELAVLAEVFDADGDLLDFDITWFVNTEPIAHEGEKFTPMDQQRGDRIRAVVIASDGDADTEERETNTVVIANRDPRIVSAPATVSANGSFRYAVEVEDEDGDRAFRYRFEEAPSGMSVDPVVGEILWQPGESQHGTHWVEVVVSDRHGGEARQRFDLTVAPTAAEPLPAALAEDR
jgi:hypothetical protein